MLANLLVAARWILPALLPTVFFVVLVHRSDARREPPWLVGVTFVLGALAALLAGVLTERAAALTGLDLRVSAAGESGALAFLFFVVAPAQEAGKVAAAWPAFMSKHFDEPYDGVVYSAASALGFAAVENAFVIHAHSSGNIWIARAASCAPGACLLRLSLGLCAGPGEAVEGRSARSSRRRSLRRSSFMGFTRISSMAGDRERSSPSRRCSR